MKVDVRVDVSAAVGTGESLTAVATVYVPDDITEAVAFFGFPGGGYNRQYYDLTVGGDRSYSQAAYHVDNGFIFVTCDHLGVGESDTPTEPLELTAVGRANAALADRVLGQLRDGTLADGLAPIEVRAAVAMGQSYGGLVLTQGQAAVPVFDGVAILGSSAIQTRAPWPADVTIEDMFALKAGNGLDHPMRPTFHFEDVPEQIVVEDMTKRPFAGSAAAWSTDLMPGGRAVIAHNPLAAGIVAAEAATITVPVLVGVGEIDVVPDPRAEATAYAASPDITVVVVPRMGHMHNFATTREQLWDRLELWAETVAAL
jgi:pimeloyl-ACP methyl ester carboxylesterase